VREQRTGPFDTLGIAAALRSHVVQAIDYGGPVFGAGRAPWWTWPIRPRASGPSCLVVPAPGSHHHRVIHRGHGGAAPRARRK